MLRRLLCPFFLLCYIASTAHAAITVTIPFQAVVKAASGSSVTAATPITFSLYTAATGGTALWTETQNATPVNGLINVQLGSVIPMTLTNAAQAYYVGIAIGSDAEMTPRIQLGTVPHAASALSVPYTGISGAPTSLPPSGTAGGDLTGSYPNPTIAANAVDNTKLASDAASLNKVSGGVVNNVGGQIGIGTANPLAPLDIRSDNDDASTPNSAMDVNGAFIRIGDPDSSGTYFPYGLGIKFYADGFSHGSIVYTEATPGNDAHLDFGSSSDTGTLNIDGTPTLTMDFDSNNVGIGTTTPAAKLDVNGTATMTGFQLTASPAAGKVLTSDAYGTGSWQAVPNPYSGTINVVNGRVGIGTTSPAAALDVESGGVLTNNVFGFTNVQQGTAPVGTYINAPAAATIGFVTATTERMRINASGNVGIGTSSPTAALEVHGDVKLGGSGQYSAAATSSPVQIITGDINGSNLSVNTGIGFSVSRISGRAVGGYHVTFTTPFASVPVVTATANAEADGISATFNNPTTTGVDVLITTSTNGFRDNRFSFIAIGGR